MNILLRTDGRKWELASQKEKLLVTYSSSLGDYKAVGRLIAMDSAPGQAEFL